MTTRTLLLIAMLALHQRALATPVVVTDAPMQTEHSIDPQAQIDSLTLRLESSLATLADQAEASTRDRAALRQQLDILGKHIETTDAALATYVAANAAAVKRIGTLADALADAPTRADIQALRTMTDQLAKTSEDLRAQIIALRTSTQTIASAQLATLTEQRRHDDACETLSQPGANWTPHVQARLDGARVDRADDTQQIVFVVTRTGARRAYTYNELRLAVGCPSRITP